MESGVQLSKASELVGATPPAPAVPVSLAVKRYIERYSPQSIVVGVSGGADSLALALAAADLASRAQIAFSTVTIDHQMREESSLEAKRVTDFLRSLEIDAHIVPVDVAATGGPEGAARDARLAALESSASPNSDILLGHTLNDQAETVLLRLGRGVSLRGLAAISPRRKVYGSSVHIGRPLLDVRRDDTEAFCYALGLEPVFDPTNAAEGPWRSTSGDALPRAAIRERVLPALNKALGQDATKALARVAKGAAEDNEALDFYAHTVLEQARTEDGYSVEVLASAPRGVRLRAMRQLLAAVGARNITRDALVRADALLVDWHGQGAISFAGGVQLGRKRNLVCVLTNAS